MLLSIGMMVKNEEKHLEDCLKALQPLLNELDSELIIVDTGSTDKTIEIARKYTDKLYFKKWNNNFSEMRNITISYAEGEWFFVIDGDEILEDVQDMISFFKSKTYKKYNAANLTVRNHSKSNDDANYGMQESTRLFKRSKEFKYVGAVHNQPVFKGAVKKVNCVINHYGYVSDDKQLMERKFIRTSTILKEELIKKPNDIYYIFQLSVSYSMHGDKKEALEESTKAYELLMKENRKEDYMYAIINHSKILLDSNKYLECIKVCDMALDIKKTDELYKIDLLYYRAKSLIIIGEYEQSIRSYLEYNNMIDKYNEGKLPPDTGIINYCINYRQDSYNDLVVAYYKIKNYEYVIKYANMIDENKIIENIIDIIIESYVKLHQYKKLKEYYEEKVINLNGIVVKKFDYLLKNIVMGIETPERLEVEKEFENLKEMNDELFQLKIEDSYEGRLSIENICSSDYIKDMNVQPDSFGKVLYAAFKNKYDIRLITEKLSYDTLVRFLNYSLEKFSDFKDIILNYIKEGDEPNITYERIRINVVLERILLILDEIKEEEYKLIFKDYIKNGIKLMRNIYSEYVLNEEKIFEVKNNEHEFFLYMLKADEFKETNKTMYVKYLKKALNSYPYMRKGIEYLLNDIIEHENSKNKEINNLKKLLIDNINLLISLGKIDEANNIISQYEEMLGMDMDLLLLKSQISLITEDVYIN